MDHNDVSSLLGPASMVEKFLQGFAKLLRMMEKQERGEG
jgi:hypothetical protein